MIFFQLLAIGTPQEKNELKFISSNFANFTSLKFLKNTVSHPPSEKAMSEL
jgi:hypothetical protein